MPRAAMRGSSSPQLQNVTSMPRLIQNSPVAACSGVAPATRVSHGPAHSDWMATMPPKLTMPSGEARLK